MKDQESMFPPASPDDVLHSDITEELNRELMTRKGVYPRWVEDGRIDHALAERRMLIMEAAITRLHDYRATLELASRTICELALERKGEPVDPRLVEVKDDIVNLLTRPKPSRLG